GRVGLECDDSVKTSERGFPLPKLLKHQSLIIERRRARRIDLYGLVKQAEGFLRILGLARNDPQPHQRVAVFGLNSQDFFEASFRARELPSLDVCQGLLEFSI